MRQQMDPTDGARITFDGKDLPIGSFDKIESDLSGERNRGYKFFHPVQCHGMIDVTKQNRRALTGREVRAISGVGGDASTVADAIGADLHPLDEFLRDPMRFE